MSSPDNDVYYAVKKLKKGKQTTDDDGEKYPENENIFSTEVRILFSSKDSKHILDIHSVWEDDTWWYLVLECGDNDFRHIGKLEERKAKEHGKSLLSALDYLHSTLEFAHCDLKPENILRNKNGDLKLFDFGQSEKMENGKLENAAGTPGYKAPELMTLGVAGVIGVGRSARVTNSCDLYGDYFKKGTAVEIIKSARESDFGNEWEVRCQKTNKTCIINEEDLEDTEEVDATYLGAPVDVWNFGFCLWSMLVNPKYGKESNNPFEPAEWHDDKDEKWWKEEKNEQHKIRCKGAYGLQFSNQIEMNILGRKPFDPFQVHAERIASSNISEDAIRVMKWCLQRDPAKRPTIQQLINDPYFSPKDTRRLRRRLARAMGF